MKLIQSNLVRHLTGGFATAIALFPFIIVRKNTLIDDRLLNHERIHLRQQVELLILPFYIVYLLEYFIRLLYYRNHYKAYYNISFEREAYRNDQNASYLTNRPLWAWTRHLKK